MIKRNSGSIYRRLYQIITKELNLLNINDPLIEVEETADYINKFFTNIGPNLAKGCNQPWQYSGVTCDHKLSDIETTPAKISDICKNININKVSCIDNISSEILRDAFLAFPDKL